MNSIPSANSAPRSKATYIVILLFMILAYVLLRQNGWHGSAQLHTLMEVSATLLALIVGILALVRFYSRKENTFLFIATGFIGTGLLDGYHAVVSAAVFVQHFPSPSPSLIPWSGFASRLFLPVLLWLSWAFWKRESAQQDGRVPEHLVYLVVGAWTLACFLFFALVPLPVGYKQLPVFHRPQEFMPAMFSVLALAGYLRKGRWKRDPFEFWLVLAILLWIGQSTYMSTSDKLFDPTYVASHVLKILSYLSVFVGLTVAMYHLFLAEESVVAERTEKLQQEIAERKHAEAQLRESEARLKLMLESVLTGNVIIDPETHRITDVNPVALGLIGLPRERVVGMECHQFICPAEKGRCPITDLGQSVDSAEQVLVTAAGERRDVLKTVVRVVIGGREHLLESFVDIGVRKRAERQVRLQATALESAANAIVITDSKGTIQWVNRAFTLLTGYSLEEVAGQNPRILKSGKHDEDFYKNLWNTICGGKTWTGEVTNRKKDGQLYIDQMTIAPVVSAEGEITNFVAIKQDYTERRRMEAETMKAKELAEAANRAKSEFLANMSHELRTPLNGIMGMTELVLDSELTSEQREHLQLVKTSSDSLLAVINDILDFSKIEAGKLEFEWIDFDLRNSVETALKVLAPRAHEKGLELNCQVRPEVPAMLIGDPGRLRQVMVNLVSNAIKFTEQGEVTVEVSLQSAHNGNAVVHFRVADTGIGIPADRQQVIFDAFAQADGSTTRRYGGSGLGLTVSRRLVEMFGGRLWLESAVGQGSTFHFTANLGIATSPRRGEPLPPADLEDVPVLVVDDNLTNRCILKELLTRWHMKPSLAEGADIGLVHLRQAAEAKRPFPLVLVDCQMPLMDGFAFVEHLKQDPRLATATIMMLTSVGQRGDSARCRELGVAAYLTKPIGQAELLAAIRQVLGTKAEQRDRPIDLVTRHSLQERKAGLRILLAEDNPVNRTVAVRLLERHGYLVQVAGDGNSALQQLRAGTFDLVLMDVQMPELDGFQATAAIREMEKKTGGHLPIIAMTAHALKGDRERCLAAGMDAYISKPFRIAELIREIETLRIGSKENPAWDREQALSYLEGKETLLHELLRIFVAAWPETRDRLQRARDEHNPEELAATAHLLKGELPCLGCVDVAASAARIEELVRGDNWDVAQPTLARLEADLERLVEQWRNAAEQQEVAYRG